MVHVLTGLPLAQTVGGVRYRFVGWADGSALTDAFTAGSGPRTYTAEYEPVDRHALAWHSTDIGAPITAGTADYAAPAARASTSTGRARMHTERTTSPTTSTRPSTADGTIVARVRYQTNSECAGRRPA